LQQKRLWPRSKPELRFIFTFEALQKSEPWVH
jgi:hypothetical protein